MQASETLSMSIANSDSHIKEISFMITKATEKGFTHVDLKNDYPGGVYAFFKSQGFELHKVTPPNSNDIKVYRISWGNY